MNDLEPCTTDSSTTTTNVNRFPVGCKFEPYTDKFWEMDTTSGMYKKRQQVLFNLYGFAGD